MWIWYYNIVLYNIVWLLNGIVCNCGSLCDIVVILAYIVWLLYDVVYSCAELIYALDILSDILMFKENKWINFG